MDTVIVMEGTKAEDADVAFTLKFTKARMRTPDNKADFEDVTPDAYGYDVGSPCRATG